LRWGRGGRNRDHETHERVLAGLSAGHLAPVLVRVAQRVVAMNSNQVALGVPRGLWRPLPSVGPAGAAGAGGPPPSDRRRPEAAGRRAAAAICRRSRSTRPQGCAASLPQGHDLRAFLPAEVREPQGRGRRRLVSSACARDLDRQAVFERPRPWPTPTSTAWL
jgi:hypothetical protein